MEVLFITHVDSPKLPGIQNVGATLPYKVTQGSEFILCCSLTYYNFCLICTIFTRMLNVQCYETKRNLKASNVRR